MGRCCVSDFSVPYGTDNNRKNNLDVEGKLRNTISIAANLGGKKSVWCCLFPSCRKAFTGDSINRLCSVLVRFWNENLLSLWKGMLQLDKGPQQIRLDFFPTLRLFYFLPDKFFQHSRPHFIFFPSVLLISPWALSFGFLWNTLWKSSWFFSQVKCKKTREITGTRKLKVDCLWLRHKVCLFFQLLWALWKTRCSTLSKDTLQLLHCYNQHLFSKKRKSMEKRHMCGLLCVWPGICPGYRTGAE